MSLLTSFTRPNQALGPFGIEDATVIQSYEYTRGIAVAATETYVANTQYYYFLTFPPGFSFSTVRLFIQTSAGDVEMAIYSSDGTNLTRVTTSGAVTATASAAVQTFTLGATVYPTPGVLYALGIGISNASLKLLHTGTTPANAIDNVGRLRLKEKASDYPSSSSVALSGLSNPSKKLPWFAIKNGA